MLLRDRVTLNIAPLFLRLALGVVFVWAGSSKLFYTNTYTGEDAAILQQLGVVQRAAVVAPASMRSEQAEPKPGTPEPKPDDSDNAETPSGTAPEIATDGSDSPAEPAEDEAAEQPVSLSEDIGSVRKSRVYTIALTLHSASHRPDGKRLWPSVLSSNGAIKAMSWVAPIGELLGGSLVLLGFLTRVCSLVLIGTMAVAMLVTTVGPASLSPDAFFGFLPPPRLDDQAAWVMAWMPWLFQFTLLCASFALLCTGAGRISLDALMFQRPSPGPPKPAPGSD